MRVPPTLFSDGSVIGNPGPGAWCGVIAFGDQEAILDILDNWIIDARQETRVEDEGRLVAAVKVVSGTENPSTNIRMELRGAIEAIRAFRLSSADLHTDCEFIVNAVNKGWLANWQGQDWHKKDGGEVANQELWCEFVAVNVHKHISLRHVRAHTNGTDFVSRVNSFCDEWARSLATGVGRPIPAPVPGPAQPLETT